MSEDAKVEEPKKLKTHGVLYLHGAGMPEDRETLVGDALSTIANGLIDVFSSDRFLQRHFRMATKAKGKRHGLTELDLDIFRRAEKGEAEEQECTIRMRDVLWKPTMRKRSLGDYIPLLWLWAFAFQSHTVRMVKLEKLDRQLPSDWDTYGLEGLERGSQGSRRNRDLGGRILLALGGLASTWLIAFVVGELATWLNPTWTGESTEFKQMWQIATSIISLSFVSAVLLILLALAEVWDRKGNRVHGHLHMLAIILTTAWLALFLAPPLLVVYYFDRVVLVVGTSGLAAAATFIVLRVNAWWERVVFLLMVALGIWIVTYVSSSIVGSDTVLRRLRKDMRSILADWLTTLLVTAGAPLLIALIVILDLLSVLPFVGDSLKNLAKSISEAGLWESLKDIHMFLTDASRAAVARLLIEKALCELAKEVDFVHVFSHSLGTVVAYETLVQIGNGDGVLIKINDPVHRKIKTLVTFGSPLNKIRTLANKVAQEHEVLADFDYSRFNNTVVLRQGTSTLQWVNFYSFQDVVSDVLSLYSQKSDPVRPSEFSVASANDILTAHGAYWHDQGFWNTILEVMGIVYPAAEMMRIEKLPQTRADGRLSEALRAQGIVTSVQLHMKLSDPQGRSDMLTEAGGAATEDQVMALVNQTESGRPEVKL